MRWRTPALVVGAALLALAGCSQGGEPVPGATAPTSSIESASPSGSTGTSSATDESGSVEGQALRLTVNDTVIDATMVDNATSREFAALLPLTMRMGDMLGREAYGTGLPTDLTDDAPRRTAYEIGELVYWPPTNGIAVYHKRAGTPVPEPGLIPLARMTVDDAAAFDLSDGAADVTISRAP
ncbi:hypothetical protein N802_03485 [Knoellia sinensis KCTC 19936]|uniref:Cyclophilin-like domain-containing protein n=1 Tax=Knoellia sinensis KCTC 19936 TaxID=1385520 RepID=A0A0A0J2S6_9MICO|nr:cyclophilin-like fold protein [Knoellia sinensis]KGN31438.1 hypothetical protein N802_03485 [Knoellia sinensis KCTC 19936]